MNPVSVYVALGSNLGDRVAQLRGAITQLQAAPQFVLHCQSSFYETAPVGGPAGQGAYLNAVVGGTTTLSPDAFLALLLTIEQRLGRVRSVPNAPRTLDLDLLLYGDLVRPAPDPIVPHPRMHERRFVLEPLVEIAPDVLHPTLHLPMRTLLAQLPAEPDPPRVVALAQRGPFDLTGQRALVTGSTSGIGRAIARALANAGANVIVHGRRSRDAAQEVAHSITSAGRAAQVLLADLADATACGQLLTDAWDVWSGLDIVVLNAGADLLTGAAPGWSFEQKWRALAAIDLGSTLLLGRGFGARMQAATGGTILTMGWDQAETGMEGESGQLFGAAKAAVMGFTKSLAKTLAPKVRVNCLAPGWIKTAWGESASEGWQERVQRETPLQRWGLPDDIAHTACWLASPAAQFITGQIIRINGGAV